MSKQEKLEKQRIGGMLICLALLTAGSMLFLPRLVRMGLQRVGFGREETVMISPPPSPPARPVPLRESHMRPKASRLLPLAGPAWAFYALGKRKSPWP